MHSTDTSTTIPTTTIPTTTIPTTTGTTTTGTTTTGTTTTDTTETASPAGRPRLRTLVGGVIAVGGLTFGIGAAVAQDSPSSVPAVGDHPAIAEMARSNGLTGLSPASLAPVAARPDAALADWAREQNLTGLSPASLAPSRASAWYADAAEIADWARANGLTGLSPASLTPVD